MARDCTRRRSPGQPRGIGRGPLVRERRAQPRSGPASGHGPSTNQRCPASSARHAGDRRNAQAGRGASGGASVGSDPSGAGGGSLGAPTSRSAPTRGSHSSQLGQVPVPVAEQLHRRRQQHAADDRRVDQHGGGEADAHLLEVEERQGDEDREHADHHDRGAGHGPGGGRDPLPDGLVGAHPAVVELADPGEDEDVVVHREPEQDHEQEQRQPVGHPAVRGEPEQRLAVAVLEDEHQHAVGGADREQVEDDRLDRDHDRAERDQHQQEREPEDEGEDQRQPARELIWRSPPSWPRRRVTLTRRARRPRRPSPG